jgi:hypothetical protein
MRRVERLECRGVQWVVLARHARNERLADAIRHWALSALRGSPGARTYYDAMRARKIGHEAALRQLGNRLIGILHGCLKTHPLRRNHRLGTPHAGRRLTTKILGCLRGYGADFATPSATASRQ